MKCDEDIGRAVAHKEMLCVYVEREKKLTDQDDGLSARGKCEVAESARTIVGWIKFTECSELIRGKRLRLKLKQTVQENYARQTMQMACDI